MNIRCSAFTLLFATVLCLAVLAGPAAAATPFQNLNSYASLIQPGSGSVPVIPVPSPAPSDIIPSDPLSQRTISISSMLINIQPYVPSNDLSQFTYINRNSDTGFSWDDIFGPITPPGGCGG
ncbi:MAG: hypothetical protein GKC05_05730 [Methanomicrobiales archaeon]|nr:hypothetical protein [Methanomicrobiales archaeon]